MAATCSYSWHAHVHVHDFVGNRHLAFVFKSIPRLPKGFAALKDQWRRAATSVPMNIAEAVGKTSAADRANRYAIARGEAMECGAIIDVVKLLERIPDTELDAAKQLLIESWT